MREDQLAACKNELAELQEQAKPLIRQLQEAMNVLREGYTGDNFTLVPVPSTESVTDLSRNVARVKARISELES